MTLQQLSTVKRWHLLHRRASSVESNLWDLMLAAWVAGMAGVLPACLLAPVPGLLGCVALVTAPGAYVALRRRLHRQGRLRCDWLASAER